MMKRFVLFLVLFSCFSIVEVKAQNTAVSDSTQSTIVSEEDNKALDTNESIKYMGSSLWFQMKKRLNLTTEEEENKEAEKKKKKKILSIGGIRIES